MLNCYATPGKAKASLLCDLFAQGVRAAGGDARLAPQIPAQLLPGGAVFYGVTAATAHLWAQARAEGRDWYYIDNSYFDATRGTYYRITRNSLQHHGIRESDGTRRAALGIEVKPWRNGVGGHVVVCLQSPDFMRTVAGIDPEDWWRQVSPNIRAMGKPIRLRGWNGNKKVQQQTLAADLEDASALFTWSSAAAVTALLAGVQVQCAASCAAYGVAAWQREAWADTLADNQWTLAEIGDGTAWRMLNA